MTFSKLKSGSELSVFNIYVVLNHAVYTTSYANIIIFTALVKILIFNEVDTLLIPSVSVNIPVSYHIYD